jgi:hypothetical protein
MALSGMLLATGCADSMEDDPELNASRQELVKSMNGLRAVNGLTAKNGLKAVNGLSVRNGLKSINGLTSVNGLTTRNGLRSFNGLEVDCLDGTAGTDCTGEPDGLLSAGSGMMSSDDGINTAKYVVRCALPAGDSIRVKDYTGALVELDGEIGFAPEWKTGDCDNACQEKVSACLLSLTNSLGNHVSVELAAPFTVGTGHTYPYQEAAFYGNLFLDRPASAYAVGKDFAGVGLLGSLFEVANRACAAYESVLGRGRCPVIEVGKANRDWLDIFGLSSGKCSMWNGVATSCKDKSGKNWSYPVTTYRLTKGAT